MTLARFLLNVCTFSSDDEVQKVIAEVAGVRRPAKKRTKQEENNEFERDMENEMSNAFQERTKEWFGAQQQRTPAGQLCISASTDSTSGNNPSTSNSVPSTSKPAPKTYGEDSDSDDEELKLNAKGTESDEGKMLW